MPPKSAEFTEYAATVRCSGQGATREEARTIVGLEFSVCAVRLGLQRVKVNAFLLVPSIRELRRHLCGTLYSFTIS